MNNKNQIFIITHGGAGVHKWSCWCCGRQGVVVRQDSDGGKIDDCGWQEITRQLTYKAEKHGRTMVKIDSANLGKTSAALWAASFKRFSTNMRTNSEDFAVAG